MEPLSVLIATAALLIPLYLLFRPSNFPSLPGPPWYDYLRPNGLARKLYTDTTQNMHTLLALAQKYGDPFQVWLGKNHTVLTADPADIVHIMTSRAEFDRTPAMHSMFESAIPNSLFTMASDDHLRARRLLRASFNHSKLPDFHARMQDAIAELFARIDTEVAKTPRGKPSAVVDITSHMSIVTFRAILAVAFGVDLALPERLAFALDVDTLMHELLAELIGYPVRQMLTPLGVRDNFLRTTGSIQATVREWIASREAQSESERARRVRDLLDAIIEVGDGDATTTESQAVLFTLAGAHTTNMGIVWCLYRTCQDARVTEKICREVDAVAADREDPGAPLSFADVGKLTYVSKVFKESMRLVPPAGYLFRRTQKDVTLRGSGVHLPRGTQVVAFYRRAQTSEKVWERAGEFVPERWGDAEQGGGEGDSVAAGAYVPFSVGARNCPGQFFAEYESVLVIAELHRRFSMSLGCEPEEVVACSGYLEVGRYSSKGDGVLDMGVPMRFNVR